MKNCILIFSVLIFFKVNAQTISGTVYTPENKAPLKVGVAYLVKHESDLPVLKSTKKVDIEKTGAFSFSGLEKGTYFIITIPDPDLYPKLLSNIYPQDITDVNKLLTFDGSNKTVDVYLESQEEKQSKSKTAEPKKKKKLKLGEKLNKIKDIKDNGATGVVGSLIDKSTSSSLIDKSTSSSLIDKSVSSGLIDKSTSSSLIDKSTSSSLDANKSEKNTSTEKPASNINASITDIGTIVKYSLSQDSKVSLELYNMSGNKIATIIEGRRKAGNYEHYLVANKDKLNSAVYLLKIIINGNTDQEVYWNVR